MKVLLTENNPLIRAGLIQCLSAGDVDVIVCGNEPAARDSAIEFHRPQVLIAGVDVVTESVLDELVRLSASESGPGVVLHGRVLKLEAVQRLANIFNFIKGGFLYLPTSELPCDDGLLHLCEIAASKTVVVNPIQMGHLDQSAEEWAKIESVFEHTDSLMLDLIAEGATDRAIASRLGVPEDSIEPMIDKLARELGVAGPDSHPRVAITIQYLTVLGRLPIQVPASAVVQESPPEQETPRPQSQQGGGT